MANVILDQQINQALMKVLKYAILVNWALLFIELYTGYNHETKYLTASIIIHSLGVSVMVSVCGWIFKKNLENYFAGKFIGRVSCSFNIGAGQRTRHMHLLLHEIFVRCH